MQQYATACRPVGWLRRVSYIHASGNRYHLCLFRTVPNLGSIYLTSSVPLVTPTLSSPLEISRRGEKESNLFYATVSVHPRKNVLLTMLNNGIDDCRGIYRGETRDLHRSRESANRDANSSERSVRNLFWDEKLLSVHTVHAFFFLSSLSVFRVFHCFDIQFEID